MKSNRRLRRAALRFRAVFMEELELRTLLTSGIGVYDPVTAGFSLRNDASAGTATVEFEFGDPGLTPVVGDWNGDGQDDFGVFDPSTATWSLRYGAESGAANAGIFTFGSTGSIPVVGDWNGDGRDDIGTFLDGTWELRYGASPGIANAGEFTFGSATSQPVVGDWDGDGQDGIGVVDAGQWSLLQTASASSPSAGTFAFGASGEVAVTGDWDGDDVDGIGVFQPATATWSLRQTATAGAADAGVFVFGAANTVPITGDFEGDPAPADALATVVLPPVNLNLLGVEINTSPITITVTTTEGDGKLLGNLLTTVSGLVDLNSVSDALNEVLDSTINLLNTATMNITGAVAGPLDTAPVSESQVLELFVAPVHLELLGAVIDTSPIRATITTQAGDGLLLGNALTELINLFNPPLPEELDIDFLNQQLDELIAALNQQLPTIAPAPIPPVPISEGQILNVTVPPIDLNLLGLVLETSPITVNASAESGDGALLGNVLTTALKTLDATPENLSELNTNINEILAKVVGVLNAADLTLLSDALDALPPVLETLLSPTLTAPAPGSVAPILDLLIASTDGESPPVQVDLLGLSVTTSNIEAHLSAVTGDGQVLGNLLYNLANLADFGGPVDLLGLLNLLGAGTLDVVSDVTGGAVSPEASTPEELLTIIVKPLDLDLLGLEVNTDPIIVNLATQAGDGNLLGNLLGGIANLINVDAVSNALNNVLSTAVDLLNAASLSVDGVGTGEFDTAAEAVTPVAELFVAPVHLDLLGLVATTEPIHLTITARSGDGLVLGNVVTALANLFNPPLPDALDIDFINDQLAQLVTSLNEQIPLIPPAPVPVVELEPEQILELTVPPLDLDLLGLELQSSPITVNAFANTGDGLLLGNILTTALNTLDATTENLTGLSNNLNALLAKVIGVLNATDLVLPTNLLDALPTVLQTLALPTLVTPTAGATTEILNLAISTDENEGPPVDVDLLGLSISTSNIEAQLNATTGEGNLLGNLLYNVANLLNPDEAATLLSLLTQLGDLDFAVSGLPTVTIDQATSQLDPVMSGVVHFTVVFSEAVTGFDASDISLSGTAGGSLSTIVTPIGTAGTTFDVAISGLTTAGTLIAAINTGAAIDIDGNLNLASTSTDNVVTFVVAGDGDTVGLYDPFNSVFYLDTLLNGTTSGVITVDVPNVAPNWVPLAGDWDGDGVATVGLYDPTGSVFYLNNETDGSLDNLIVFDVPSVPSSWVPIAGDWDGDGIDSVGLYDRSGQTFYLNNQTDGSLDNVIVFSLPGASPNWIPISGDWDGDGDDTVGLYNRTAHTFHLNNKTDGSVDDVTVFTTPTVPRSWLPVAGDWDNDGVDTVGLYDRNGHTFYLNNETDGSTDNVLVFVTPTVPRSWLPIAGHWGESAAAIAGSAMALGEWPHVEGEGSTTLDVDGNGTVTPLDALGVINFMNAFPADQFPQYSDAITLYDTTGDGNLSPMDVLVIANHLNSETGAEGESVIFISTPASGIGSVSSSAAGDIEEEQSNNERVASPDVPAEILIDQYFDEMTTDETDSHPTADLDDLLDSLVSDGVLEAR